MALYTWGLAGHCHLSAWENSEPYIQQSDTYSHSLGISLLSLSLSLCRITENCCSTYQHCCTNYTNMQMDVSVTLFYHRDGKYTNGHPCDLVREGQVHGVWETGSLFSRGRDLHWGRRALHSWIWLYGCSMHGSFFARLRSIQQCDFVAYQNCLPWPTEDNSSHTCLHVHVLCWS